MGNNGEAKGYKIPELDGERKGWSPLVKLALAGGVTKAVIAAGVFAYMVHGEPIPEKIEERPVIEKKIEVEEEIKKEEKKPEIKVKKLIVEKKASLDEILSRNCEIEKIINPNGVGNIYLVGSQANVFLKDKNDKVVLVRDDNTPLVQSDVYHLLTDLVEEKDLRLVMGKGIGPRELVGFGHEKYGDMVGDLKEKLEDKRNVINLFREKKQLQAHAVLELLYKDEVTTFGFDDVEEVKRQNILYRKLVERHFEYKNQKDPRERELLHHLTFDLVNKLDISRTKISRIRMRDSVRRADVQNEKDVCVIVGAHAAPVMAESYETMGEKRTLYLLRPKSITKEDFYAAVENR